MPAAHGSQRRTRGEPALSPSGQQAVHEEHAGQCALRLPTGRECLGRRLGVLAVELAGHERLGQLIG